MKRTPDLRPGGILPIFLPHFLQGFFSGKFLTLAKGKRKVYDESMKVVQKYFTRVDAEDARNYLMKNGIPANIRGDEHLLTDVHAPDFIELIVSDTAYSAAKKKLEERTTEPKEIKLKFPWKRKTSKTDPSDNSGD